MAAEVFGSEETAPGPLLQADKPPLCQINSLTRDEALRMHVMVPSYHLAAKPPGLWFGIRLDHEHAVADTAVVYSRALLKLVLTPRRRTQLTYHSPLPKSCEVEDPSFPPWHFRLRNAQTSERDFFQVPSLLDLV